MMLALFLLVLISAYGRQHWMKMSVLEERANYDRRMAEFWNRASDEVKHD